MKKVMLFVMVFFMLFFVHPVEADTSTLIAIQMYSQLDLFSFAIFAGTLAIFTIGLSIFMWFLLGYLIKINVVYNGLKYYILYGSMTLITVGIDLFKYYYEGSYHWFFELVIATHLVGGYVIYLVSAHEDNELPGLELSGMTFLMFVINAMLYLLVNVLLAYI